MKNVFGPFLSRINNRLLLLSVIPVAVVTAILTWYTIESRQAEIVDFYRTTVTTAARQLARVSDFALYAGRRDILEPLASAGDDLPAIAAIYYLDAERNPVLGSRQLPELTPEALSRGDYSGLPQWLFAVEEPVYPQAVEVSDFDDPPSRESNSHPLGWVVVVGDNSPATTEAREILVSHILISFSVLLGAIILTYYLSDQVVAPVRTMTRVVRELEQGNLDARIVPTTGDELAILANGINHLARAVAEGRESLENKVQLSTRRLTVTLEDLKRKNRELENARREAEEASAAKGDFLAQMSHELRTPITAIQGFVKLLAGADLKPAEARYCTIIQQASSQLLQLIDDILDITRLQSNAIVIDESLFDLAECIEAPISLMAPIAHEKGIELILDVAPNVPYELVGDTLRIRQIIYNLISNAIKFTPAGYVLVRVRLSERIGERIALLIQVTDTGIGIPDRQQTGLFEPFSQADTSISRRFGGSGLGLSIVKRLMDLMAGEIRLDSTTGKGTTFTLTLPLLAGQKVETLPAPGRRCVLLFDSHPQSRQALENILSRYVDVIDSCDSLEDLEISAPRISPEMIVYSPRSDTPLDVVEKEIAALRSVSAALIAVFTPTNKVYESHFPHWLDRYQPITILDKPPLASELMRLFSEGRETESDADPVVEKMAGARILVAEDNEFTRILLSAFFDDTGSVLTLVANGSEAIQACRAETYDLVLMDVHMPEVNGIAALQEIRRDGLNRDTPIIMLTADILQQEENALFDLGASDLVFKPFDEVKLLSAIRKHLRGAMVDSPPRPETETSKSDRRSAFFREVDRLGGVAKTALEARDGAGLRDAIHQLLGIAGVYRMPYLERAVLSLHQAVKAGDGNKIMAAMETLTLEVDKLAKETP